MKHRIFASMSLLALITVLLSSILMAGVMYRQSLREMQQEVRNSATYVAAGLNLSGQEYLSTVTDASDTNRITLVAGDGTVLFDSVADPKKMDNHLSRSEIAAALRTGHGEAVRLSDTLDTETYYYALQLDNGTVVRVANTVDSVYSKLLDSVPYLVMAIIATFALAVLLANRQTEKIVTPINALDLDDPISNDIYDELSPLVTRIANQKAQIRRQISELKAKREEFAAISENMSEGLVILNAKAAILSMNQSAKRFFGVKDDDFLTKHILTLNRSLELRIAVEETLKGNPSEKTLTVGERHYQLLANPVWVEKSVEGAIVLILDVTEKHMAEQMRREFSANVSHELKTPLTSISGYAEIVMNGLVPPQDIPGAAKRIYTEARRLIALVEDIIQLSQLDENTELAKEPVDLLALSQEIREKLLPEAENRGVTLTVRGEPALIFGTRHILRAMIYNLCDNAIKYNRADGTVDISIAQSPEAAVLTVADTGIGIPYEHQGRVFERFYRVDKSHSRATGGTGLGLSIVKRGAIAHRARVSLESEPNRGTAITLHFPR